MSWIIGLAWLALLSPAGGKAVVVLELHDEARVGAPAAAYLTDNVRGEATEVLGRSYMVLTRENVLSLMPPGTDLAECVGDCEVAIARKVGADFVITGGVVPLGHSLRLSLQLHDTRTGRLLGRRTASAVDVEALERVIPSTVRELLQPLAPQRGFLLQPTLTLVEPAPTTSGQTSLGVSLGVVGGLLVGAGLAAALANQSYGDDLRLDPEDEFARDEVENSYYASRALYISGGALLGVGVLLWLLDDDDDDPTAGLQVGPQGAGWAGTF